MHSPTNSASVRAMFDAIAPTYDLLNTVLSFGLNTLWERKAVRALPTGGKEVCLDLCTGTGALVPLLSQRFTRVVAADISPEMLSIGRSRHSKLDRVEWVEADALALPFAEGTFDGVTCAYGVRNFPDRHLGLREMARVTKVGGRVMILEFGQPTWPIWRSLFGLYSRFVIPCIGRCVSGNKSAYQYLPETASVFPCGQQFEQLLRDCGWIPETSRSLSGGVAYIYVARKP